jgi:hypothetical protein
VSFLAPVSLFFVLRVFTGEFGGDACASEANVVAKRRVFAAWPADAVLAGDLPFVDGFLHVGSAPSSRCDTGWSMIVEGVVIKE